MGGTDLQEYKGECIYQNGSSENGYVATYTSSMNPEPFIVKDGLENKDKKKGTPLTEVKNNG